MALIKSSREGGIRRGMSLRLTDEEWLQLRIEAYKQNKAIGTYVADIVLKSLPLTQNSIVNCTAQPLE